MFIYNGHCSNAGLSTSTGGNTSSGENSPTGPQEDSPAGENIGDGTEGRPPSHQPSLRVNPGVREAQNSRGGKGTSVERQPLRDSSNIHDPATDRLCGRGCERPTRQQRGK
jgi:hypothetical protein